MTGTTKEQLEQINQQIKELVGVHRAAQGSRSISENEFWVWYSLIMAEENVSQQDICAMWSLSKQTVNTIITQMGKKGFVSLEVVPGSKNRKIISLTEAGERYGKELVMPVSAAEQRAFERLPEEDRTAVTAVLGKYIDLLKEELYDATH